MHRHYFLFPDTDRCRQVVEALIAQGVPRHHQHVLAGPGHPMAGLPAASIWQTSELPKGLWFGMTLGGLAGALGGLMILLFPTGDLTLGRPELLGITLAGALFCGGISALMKVHQHNRKLDPYRLQLDLGEVLLIVDAAASKSGLVQRIASSGEDSDSPGGDETPA